MSYWKTVFEFQRDLERVDADLTAAGLRPTNTRRARALHIHRDTLYVWLDKLADYERAVGLTAVGQ